jgi:hypothetical protein
MPGPPPEASDPGTKLTTIRSRRGQRKGRPINSSLTWSLAPAPPATHCAWCAHQFDEADDRHTGRVFCARCGVATTSPWPSARQLDEAYGSWYRPETGRFVGLGDKVLRRTRAALATRLHQTLPPGPVLDVGAGDGTLVQAFLRHGREAVGLEPHASDRTFAIPRSRRCGEPGPL